jgi:hypothetical protein
MLPDCSLAQRTENPQVVGPDLKHLTAEIANILITSSPRVVGVYSVEAGGIRADKNPDAICVVIIR